jgi:hypothetical protein
MPWESDGLGPVQSDIAVYRKDSVAKLDAFVGPKR